MLKFIFKNLIFEFKFKDDRNVEKKLTLHALIVVHNKPFARDEKKHARGH